MLQKPAAVLLTFVTGIVAIVYVETGGPIHAMRGFDVEVRDTANHPVQNAIVTAIWRTSSLACIHGDCFQRTIRTVEVATDASGRAVLPTGSGSATPSKS